MAFDAFLKLDGIKGEASDGSITLESFSWGVSNSGSQATGGGGSGRAVFQDFSFNSVAGSEAADLFLAAVSGKVIKSGQLTISDKTPLITITFSDVLISSYKLDEGPLSLKLDKSSTQPQLGPPMENVSFNFAKFVFQAAGGSTASGSPGTGTVG